MPPHPRQQKIPPPEEVEGKLGGEHKRENEKKIGKPCVNSWEEEKEVLNSSWKVYDTLINFKREFVYRAFAFFFYFYLWF